MRWGDFRRSDNVEDRTGGMPEGAAAAAVSGSVACGLAAAR